MFSQAIWKVRIVDVGTPSVEPGEVKTGNKEGNELAEDAGCGTHCPSQGSQGRGAREHVNVANQIEKVVDYLSKWQRQIHRAFKSYQTSINNDATRVITLFDTEVRLRFKKSCK